MSQWGFYFNQDRCFGCKACILACKTWNEKNRGDKLINASSEELILANPAYTVQEGQAQPATAFIDSTGAIATAELGRYTMKENWRRVEEFDKGAITTDSYTNTFVSTFERSYTSISCNHCSEPACRDACPADVIYKEEETGLVLYNSNGCISCGRCKTACPWSAPQFYDNNYAAYPFTDESRPRMTKCTGCKDRISENLKPACVAACRARALDFGPMEELKDKYNHNVVLKVDGFDPDKTQPNILFRAKTNSIS